MIVLSACMDPGNSERFRPLMAPLRCLSWWMENPSIVFSLMFACSFGGSIVRFPLMSIRAFSRKPLRFGFSCCVTRQLVALS